MTQFFDFLSPIQVSLSQLLLDPNNPRFAEIGEGYSPVPESRIAEERVQQKAFDRMLFPRFDVPELRDTIRTVGYLPVDRIIIRSCGEDKTTGQPLYVVVEGNRRITALKWLIDLHAEGKETLNPKEIENLENIPALLLDEERAPSTARLILPGLRHVSGVKEWGPYQRAKAVNILREGGQPPKEVAQSLGLSTQAANQLWRSFLALEQMRKDEEYGEFVTPRLYSYFEEIIKRPNVRNWLAWDDNERTFTDEDNVKELYSWIIGELIDEGDEQVRSEPKLPEAKSIRDLGKFIDNETSFTIFRSAGGSLTSALSRFEADHQQEWQGIIATAQSTLKSLTPDTLRSLADNDLDILENLRDRIISVLKDRDILVGDR